MELIEKDLQAVRTLLPRRQQDDIIRELSENLQSQFDDREADLGRPLTEAEIADIIRRHGHPLVVAGRYRSRQQLVGPAMFPLYLWVLKLGLGVALAVTLALTGVDLALHGGGIGEILTALLAYPARALMVFAWTTLCFAAFELIQSRLKLTHDWDPRLLPKVVKPTDRLSRWNALCELLATSGYLAWLLLVPRVPFLLFGPLYRLLEPAPIWSSVYVPIVALALGTLALSAANVVRPYRTPLRSWMRVALHGGALAVVIVLARADAWVAPGPGPFGPNTANVDRLVAVVNSGVSIGLWITGAVSLIESGREIRRWWSVRGRTNGAPGVPAQRQAQR